MYLLGWIQHVADPKTWWSELGHCQGSSGSLRSKCCNQQNSYRLIYYFIYRMSIYQNLHTA